MYEFCLLHWKPDEEATVVIVEIAQLCYFYDCESGIMRIGMVFSLLFSFHRQKEIWNYLTFLVILVITIVGMIFAIMHTCH